MSRRIAIVHYGGTPFATKKYFLRLLIPEWEAMGWEVVVVEQSRDFVPADIAISHINLTRVPRRWRRVLARYPRVINSQLTDISKSRFSTLLLREGDGWNSSVIVKTDANCGGRGEHDVLLRRIGTSLPFARRIAGKLLSWRHLTYDQEYPIFDSPAGVPVHFRSNRNYVIEKFVPERDGELFVLRIYTFLGDRGTCTKARSSNRIIKAVRSVDVSIIETPPEIVAFARTFGADYGKIDFVLRDGAPVVLDVNGTPTFSTPEPNERHKMIARQLAPAIEQFL